MNAGRRTLLTGTGAALAGLAGCSAVFGTENEEYDVGMSTEEFLPERIEIEAGDTVVWKNTSSHAHTVTAYEAGIPEAAEYFASGDFEGEQAARDGYLNKLAGSIAAGSTYEHTFTVPGEYQYFCVPHERAEMVGTVVVD